MRHEFAGPPVDAAGARQAQPVSLARRQHRGRALGRRRLHSGDPARRLAYCRQHRDTTGIIFRPGADSQRGIVGQMKIDAALELERADEIAPATRHDHAARHGRGGVDRPLNCRCVQGYAVAYGTEVADVEFAPAGAKRFRLPGQGRSQTARGGGGKPGQETERLAPGKVVLPHGSNQTKPASPCRAGA